MDESSVKSPRDLEGCALVLYQQRLKREELLLRQKLQEEDQKRSRLEALQKAEEEEALRVRTMQEEALRQQEEERERERHRRKQHELRVKMRLQQQQQQEQQGHLVVGQQNLETPSNTREDQGEEIREETREEKDEKVKEQEEEEKCDGPEDVQSSSSPSLACTTPTIQIPERPASQIFYSDSDRVLYFKEAPHEDEDSSETSSSNSDDSEDDDNEEGIVEYDDKDSLMKESTEESDTQILDLGENLVLMELDDENEDEQEKKKRGMIREKLSSAMGKKRGSEEMTSVPSTTSTSPKIEVEKKNLDRSDLDDSEYESLNSSRRKKAKYLPSRPVQLVTVNGKRYVAPPTPLEMQRAMEEAAGIVKTSSQVTIKKFIPLVTQGISGPVPVAASRISLQPVKTPTLSVQPRLKMNSAVKIRSIIKREEKEQEMAIEEMPKEQEEVKREEKEKSLRVPADKSTIFLKNLIDLLFKFTDQNLKVATKLLHRPLRLDQAHKRLGKKRLVILCQVSQSPH